MKILLIEDNPGDILLAKEGFKAIGFNGELSVLHDGMMAQQYFNNMSKELKANKACCRPDLILLDLNLPRVSGLELLQSIKGDPLLKHIPVVILTTSMLDSDVSTSRAFQANSYLVKPMDFKEFVQLLDSTVKSWNPTTSYTAFA